jgi:hypothetical protein
MRAHSHVLGAALAAFALWGAAAWGAEHGPVTVRAVLIRASNEPAAQDARLENVEYKLRRIFGFEYYRFMGESSAALPAGGEATLDLGGGHRLRISMGDADGSVRAVVRWYRGDDLVLNTTVRAQRKTPVILGGASEGNGTLIITLTAE